MADAAGAEPLRDGDPTEVGPYTLSGRLGVGGMGSVYFGHSAEGQPVAVKVIRPEFAADPAFRARFLREVRAARRVARFCTAEVLDVDVERPEPYLVTEYIEGPTLAARVRRDGPLPAAELERLAVAVANALTAIHAANVIHRDLKPGNILLSPSGARVIDFGIARAMESTTVHTLGGIVGTPAYMAPEQALGLELTPAADVYAWGGVLLYAASGRTPFGDGATPVVLHRVVYDEPDFSCLDDGLLPVVRQAMSKDPAARPSAHELMIRLASGPAPGADTTPRAAEPTLTTTTTTTTPASVTPTPSSLAPPPWTPVDQGVQGETNRVPGEPRRRYRALLVVAAVAVVAALVGVLFAFDPFGSDGQAEPVALTSEHPPATGTAGDPAPGGHAGSGPTAAGPSSSPRTPGAQTHGWLVFKRYQGDSPINDSPIVSVAPDGTEHQLGTGDGPTIAPDGSRVAYAAANGQLATVHPDGTDPRELASGGDGSAESPAWSPDSTQLAFFRNTGGLYLTHADGTGTRRIAAVHGLEPSWSPDGGQIVFRNPNKQTLEIVSTTDGSVRPLTGSPRGGTIPVEPAWSPDGSTIVFGTADGGIYAIAPDGTGLREVAGEATWHPTWSPDGRVVYVRDATAGSFIATRGRVETMKADGSNVRPLGSVVASGPVQWARG